MSTPSISSVSQASNFTPNGNLTCPNVKVTTISYTMTVIDSGIPGYTYDNFYNGSILNTTPGTAGFLFPVGQSFPIPPNTINIGPFGQKNSFTIPASSPSSNSWYAIASNLAPFKFNLGRLCNVTLTPNSSSNITSINIVASITDERSNNPNLPNDNLSSTCLGAWIVNWLQNYTVVNPGIPPSSSALNSPQCQTSTFTGSIPDDANFIENYSPFMGLDKSHLTIIDIKITEHEDYTNVGMTTTLPVIMSPATTILPSQCANTYVCPGSGSGFGIQFNIVEADVSMLSLPSGLTVAASALQDYTATPQRSVTNDPLTWWWANIVLKFPGVAGPTPMLCVQPYQKGFAIGLAQTICSAFAISPSRVCGAKLTPTMEPNDIDVASVKFTFYITDVHPKSSPLANDYLPSACLGTWILSWLTKSTSITSPNQAIIPVPESIPASFQSENCPALLPGAPTPTLYFTNQVNIDKNIPVYIDILKNTFRNQFSPHTMLAGIFAQNTLEHASNVSGTSIKLSGSGTSVPEHATNVSGTSIKLSCSGTSVYPAPITIFDYFFLYAYPISFLGAIFFTVVQIIDVNINTIIANKNLSLAINISFIAWSVVSMAVFYNLPIYSSPILGSILSADIPFVLPFNTQSVVTQA